MVNCLPRDRSPIWLNALPRLELPEAVGLAMGVDPAVAATVGATVGVVPTVGVEVGVMPTVAVTGGVLAAVGVTAGGLATGVGPVGVGLAPEPPVLEVEVTPGGVEGTGVLDTPPVVLGSGARMIASFVT